MTEMLELDMSLFNEVTVACKTNVIIKINTLNSAVKQFHIKLGEN